MSEKPHICMVGSGTGSWGVYKGRDRAHRLVGKNNTFRSPVTARAYARSVYFLVTSYKRQFEQQDSFHTTQEGL